MSDAYVLLTAHKTILDVDDSGALTSHLATSSRFRPRLIVDVAGKVLEPLPGELAQLLRLERIDGDDFGLRVGDSYICAEAGGAFSRAQAVSTWETFRLVPLAVATRTAGRDVPLAFPLKPHALTIARTIHQTSKPVRIPDAAEEMVAAMRALNPGWSYRYWSNKDAHDFIYAYFGYDVLEAYHRISACYGAARADFFRYLLVYQLGGVYLDMKSAATRPFDDILRPDDQFILAQWTTGVGVHPELDGFMTGSEYQQWHVIAAAGHPFLAAVIEQVLRNIRDYDSELDGVGALGVLRATGPIAYSRAIHPIRDLHPHRMVNPDEAGLVFERVARPERAAHYSIFRTPIVS